MSGRVGRSKDRDRKCLRLEDWPAPDRQAWETIIQPGDDIDEGGLGSLWAPTTRQTNIECYGRWLSWLQKQQRLDHDLQPADRANPADIAAYVGELRRLNASTTATARIRHLYT